jgi:hypothetical protein
MKEENGNKIKVLDKQYQELISNHEQNNSLLLKELKVTNIEDGLSSIKGLIISVSELK